MTINNQTIVVFDESHVINDNAIRVVEVRCHVCGWEGLMETKFLSNPGAPICSKHGRMAVHGEPFWWDESEPPM